MRNLGGKTNIFAMRPDGSGAIRLTTHSASDFCPRWSPNGRKVALVSTRDSILLYGRWQRASEIYVMNADGSGTARLTQSDEPNGCASWSPDGRSLAFSRLDSVTGSYNIFVMDSDGSNVLRLTDDSRDSSYPQWSPNGQTILFITNREADAWAKLYSMNADGSNQRHFGDICPANVLSMNWSPDGSQIAFDCDGTYGTDVYTIRVDGTDRRRISAPVGPAAFGYDATPVWSPDGGRLVISRNSGGNLDLYLVTLNGGVATRLTNHPNLEWAADWRRTP